jgi:hypothetical protein
MNCIGNGITVHENFRALVGVKLLCLDTAPLIYLVERFPAYIDKVRTIIRSIDKRESEGVAR